MIPLDIELHGEELFNLVGLERLVPHLHRCDDFVFGQIFARYPKSHILYKENIRTAISGLVNLERFSLQVMNQDRLREEVIVQNQVSIRMFILGWYSERGLPVLAEDQSMVTKLCLIRIDFRTVKIQFRDEAEK